MSVPIISLAYLFNLYDKSKVIFAFILCSSKLRFVNSTDKLGKLIGLIKFSTPYKPSCIDGI